MTKKNKLGNTRSDVCSVDECNEAVGRKGMCEKHYMRDWRHGTPYTRIEQQNRFLAKVVSTPSSECVIWPFKVRDTGYGLARYEGKTITAHRLALIMLTGENPVDLVAAHGPCHNRLCVNPHPEHGMKWATQSENNFDRRRDGTMPAGEKNHFSTRSEEQVKTAHRMYADGRLIEDIEQETGIPRSIILGVVRGRVWAHLGLSILPYRYEKYEQEIRPVE